MGTCKYCGIEIEDQFDECWRCTSDINPKAVRQVRTPSEFWKKTRLVLRFTFAVIVFVIGSSNFIALFIVEHDLNIFQILFYIVFDLFLVFYSLLLFMANKDKFKPLLTKINCLLVAIFLVIPTIGGASFFIVYFTERSYDRCHSIIINGVIMPCSIFYVPAIYGGGILGAGLTLFITWRVYIYFHERQSVKKETDGHFATRL
jgi:hypothetical protein